MLLVVSGSVPVSFYTDTDAALLLNIDMDPADPFPQCCIKIEFFSIFKDLGKNQYRTCGPGYIIVKRILPVLVPNPKYFVSANVGEPLYFEPAPAST